MSHQWASKIKPQYAPTYTRRAVRLHTNSGVTSSPILMKRSPQVAIPQSSCQSCIKVFRRNSFFGVSSDQNSRTGGFGGVDTAAPCWPGRSRRSRRIDLANSRVNRTCFQKHWILIWHRVRTDWCAFARMRSEHDVRRRCECPWKW
jgi:hypothetical protein